MMSTLEEVTEKLSAFISNTRTVFRATFTAMVIFGIALIVLVSQYHHPPSSAYVALTCMFTAAIILAIMTMVVLQIWPPEAMKRSYGEGIDQSVTRKYRQGGKGKQGPTARPK